MGSNHRLQTQFAVRAQTRKIKVIAIRLATDQDQVGPDMAVPVILPRTGQRMIPVPRGKRPIPGNVGQDICKIIIRRLCEAAFPLPPVVPLEGCCPSYPPH